MWSYRLIKPVDIGPVLRELDRLQFIDFAQDSHGKNPLTVVCQVVLDLPLEIKDFIKNLNLGGSLARAVIRKLPRNQGIPPHTDNCVPAEYNWRRFQLPIVTHPDIIMRWPDDRVELHLAQGVLYEVNVKSIHEIINNQNEIDRIHLQIDQINATITADKNAGSSVASHSREYSA